MNSLTVVEHDTAVFEAEEFIEAALLGPLDPCSLLFSSADDKAPIVSQQEAAQHLVGLFGIACASEAELAGQAVMEGAQSLSMRPLACGEGAWMSWIPSSFMSDSHFLMLGQNMALLKSDSEGPHTS